MLLGELHNSVYSLFPTVQWGSATEPDTNNPETYVTFPIGFTFDCYSVIPTTSFNGNANFYGVSIINKSKTGFTTKSGTYGQNSVYWYAVGK